MATSRRRLWQDPAWVVTAVVQDNDPLHALEWTRTTTDHTVHKARKPQGTTGAASSLLGRAQQTFSGCSLRRRLGSRPDRWDSGDCCCDIRSDPFTVHGYTRDGEGITLLHTWIRQVAFGDQLTTVSSSTVALGATIEQDTLWSRASYGTANLTEWPQVWQEGLGWSGGPLV